MALSQAFSGVGTKLYRKDTAWAAFGEVNNINGPSFSRDKIDVSHLGSSGGYKEFIMGFRDPGEVSFDLSFNHADFLKLKDDFDAGTKRLYRIVLPDAEKSTIMFWAYIGKCPVSVPAGDKVSCNVTLTLSGRSEFYSSTSTTVTNIL